MFRKQKQILLLAGIFLLGTFVARGQDPVKLSRQDALKMALQYNTNILNSDLDLKIAQKKVWETISSGCLVSMPRQLTNTFLRCQL
jgi:uncharacterized metal-binding protein